MKNFICLFIFIWAIPQGFAQLHLTQFEQIDSLQKIEKRNIIVFIHTDWCKYCKTMQNTTLKNTELITLINNKFYFVDFDAEEKRIIVFNKAVFDFKPTGQNTGVHELALQLGTIDKQISYPALCILNDKYEIIFPFNSFLNAKDFKAVLTTLEK